MNLKSEEKVFINKFIEHKWINRTIAFISFIKYIKSIDCHANKKKKFPHVIAFIYIYIYIYIYI